MIPARGNIPVHGTESHSILALQRTVKCKGGTRLAIDHFGVRSTMTVVTLEWFSSDVRKEAVNDVCML